MPDSVKKILNHSLFDYDRQKANLLKAVFPFLIIIHHLEQYNLLGISIFSWIGIWVMYLFFAMSGYGLVISYIKKSDYIDGFLKRALPKLFIPYMFTFVLFVIYRFFEGVDQIELFKSEGLFSFIPTSWFIYILAMFYIFFFIVFKYMKSNIAVKVVLTSALVIAYCAVAPYIGIAPWRYNKCPAFIVGMFFALMNSTIREKFVIWHIFVGASILLCLMNLPFGHRFDPYLYSSVMFLLMFILPYKGGRRMSHIVNFFSSISLEMFIIQYIPIYLVMDHLVFDKSYISTVIIVALVLLLNVILAYLINKIINKVKSKNACFSN